MRIGENWHTPPSLSALAFHNAWEDRNNFDALVKTDVTPAILSRDFVAQLHRATKSQM